MQEEHMTTIPQMVEDVRTGKMPRRTFIKALTALGISATGVGIITTVSASRAFSSQPSHVVHATEERLKNLDLHQQHLAHQNQSNLGAMSNDYAEHAVVQDSMHPTPFVGREAIMQRKSITALPDLQITVTNRVAHGSQVTAEWVATGSHTTSFPGLPATGRPFTIHGVTVVIRERGKIVHEALYYDMEHVHHQLRTV